MIRKTSKHCKAHMCYLPTWGHSYCRKHQYFYAAKQPIPKFKRRKPTRTEAFGFTTLPELFMYVAYNTERPVICPVSGEDITPLFSLDFDVWKCCCAHVLSRKMYPLWRLNPRNIVLLAPAVHNLYDQGTQAQRDKHPDWNWRFLYDLKDQLKLEYEAYVKEVK